MLRFDSDKKVKIHKKETPRPPFRDYDPFPLQPPLLGSSLAASDIDSLPARSLSSVTQGGGEVEGVGAEDNGVLT